MFRPPTEESTAVLLTTDHSVDNTGVVDVDARRPVNSLESRFDLAYNAAHSLCLAALRRAGYRSSKRYVVFQALPHTLGLGPEVWRVLDHAHLVRNRSEYEGDLSVDERLLGDLLQACDRVEAALRALPPL